jgi:hypothetical protein
LLIPGFPKEYNNTAIPNWRGNDIRHSGPENSGEERHFIDILFKSIKGNLSHDINPDRNLK